MTQRIRIITPARVIIAVVLLILIIAAVILVQDLINPVAEPTPAIPPSVATVQADWMYPIMLPTAIPGCFGYKPSGSAVADQADARGGTALVVHFTRTSNATCRPSGPDPNLMLTEAPALDSLQGTVTTLSGNRGQYARLAVPDAGSRTRLILQWHCDTMMCRVEGDTGSALSEQELLQMAESVRPAKP